MGGMAYSISTGEIILFLSIVLGIFLAGYIPYVYFSVKLSREASSPTGRTTRTKVWASIFAGINSLVFFSSVSIFTDGEMLILIGDILLWGTPMFFYIKGMTGTPPSGESDLLDG